MKILIECRSITPRNSCGIENFLYSLVRGWTEAFPKDKLVLNIPPGTQAAYKAIIGDTQVEFIEDPIVRCYQKFKKQFRIIKYPVGLAKRIHPSLTSWFQGPRMAWAEETEKMVEAVIYPFQRDNIIHFNKPTLLFMHDFSAFELSEPEQRRFASVETKNIKRANAIITSWPAPFKSLTTLFFQRRDVSFMIPFHFDSTPCDQDIGSTNDARLLVYAASTAPHKNHENLILALSVLKRKNVKPIRVVCPGASSLKRMKKLKKLIEKERLNDWIKFLGFVNHSEIKMLYRNAAGVVAPTLYEAFSGTVLEAFQYAKPVCCSNIPTLRAFIDQLGVKVCLFDPNSPEDIARGILEIIDNSEPYRKGSLEARKKVSKITTKGTVTQYREVLAWAAGLGQKPSWAPFKHL